MTETSMIRQVYDPRLLGNEVEHLLRDKGLTVHYPDGRQAPVTAAAGALLRALGVFPGVDSVAHHIESADQVWDVNQDVI